MERSRSAGDLLSFLDAASNSIKSALTHSPKTTRRLNHRKYLEKLRSVRHQDSNATGPQVTRRRVISKRTTRRKAGVARTCHTSVYEDYEQNDFLSLYEGTVSIQNESPEYANVNSVHSDTRMSAELYDGPSDTRESSRMGESPAEVGVKSTSESHRRTSCDESVSPQLSSNCLLVDYLSPSSPFEDLLSSPSWKQIVKGTSETGLRLEHSSFDFSCFEAADANVNNGASRHELTTSVGAESLRDCDYYRYIDFDDLNCL